MKRIGACNLVVAKMLTDDAGGVTYDVPYALQKKLMKIGFEPSVTRAILEADDQIVDTMSGRGDTKVVINVTDLTLSEKAMFLGQTIVNGIRTSGNTDTPPYWCVMWKSLKSNGKYRYEKVLKVQFQEVKEDFETKKQQLAYQTPVLEGVGIQRLYDGKDIREADEDEPTYTASVGTNWFTSGDINPDTTAPTISSTTPANNATGVAVGSSFAWTFSKAILPSCVNSSNFFIIKDTDGSIIAGTLSQNAAKTVITFTPSANLTAATAYRAICTSDVCDLSANRLAANDVRKFTTA
jgi:phi13 family phage major tail protein